MKKQFQKQQIDTIPLIENSNHENFSELIIIVEDLIASMNQKSQGNKKTSQPKPGKKWKKNRSKKKILEDLGMRELPFTF